MKVRVRQAGVNSFVVERWSRELDLWIADQVLSEKEQAIEHARFLKEYGDKAIVWDGDKDE